MPEALVAFGGNVGDVRNTLDRALAAFCDGTAIRLSARSSDYSTPPWGSRTSRGSSTACRGRNEPDAAGAARAHRRSAPSGATGQRTPVGPRPLDIDLPCSIASTSKTHAAAPRMFEGAFVLVPLAEIAPQRVIAGRRVRDSLAAIDTSGIEKLPAR
jgi:2-amino-4-hydroxy-6-hydroxymethyldihydropteridine diphosphokinase